MVTLAAAENYFTVDGGIILLGFSTALIPVAQDSETGSIQWHFETSSEPETSRLSLHELKSIRGTWFKTKNIDVLTGKDCFVG